MLCIEVPSFVKFDDNIPSNGCAVRELKPWKHYTGDSNTIFQ